MAKKVTINGSNLLSSTQDAWGGQNTTQYSQNIHGTTVPPGAEWGMNRGEVERFIKSSINAQQSRVGYYVCDNSASTSAKAVVASGYQLATGGCVRIKMTNANTANNVTLNINSTGAKALYYDGALASSSNSWEAGEVLEVYYDGTQYKCTGDGGGKFATGEKVKEVGITNQIEDSNDLITSSAVYGLTEQSTIDLSSLTSQVCSLGGSKKWYRNGSSGPQRHIALPVVAGEKIMLSATHSTDLEDFTGWYAWCTSSYSPPYINNQAVPMVASENDRIPLPANQDPVLIIAPEDAAYLILTTVDGGGNAVSWTAKKPAMFAFNTGEKLEDVGITDELIENSTDLVESGTVWNKLNNTIGLDTTIDLSQYPAQNCSLGSTFWYMANTNKQRHKAIPVQEDEKYILSVNTTSYYAFVTSAYSPPYTTNQRIPFVPSESERYTLNGNTELAVVVPPSAAYLIITTVDGAGDTNTWTVRTGDMTKVKFATGERLDGTGIDNSLTQFSQNLAKSGDVWEELHKAGYFNELLDISGISEVPCSLGSTFWYMSNSNNQRHKAVPIIPGQYYKIKGTSANGTASALWATITSAYNPVKDTDVNFTSNETQRNMTASGFYVTFQAPPDAAYLILTTVDGGGISCTWEVTFISQCYKDVNKLAEDVESLEQGLTIRHPFDTTNAPIWNYFINTSDSIWKQSSTYRCKIIRVEMYRGMKIVATKNANATIIRFAFITSWPVKETSVIYSVGTTLVNTTDNEVTMTVPEDCIWLYLYADSDGTNVEPSVVFIESGIAPIYKELFSKESVVDISGYTEQDCSLGSSNWYMSSSNKQRHIAIPVTAGDIYAIIPNVGSFYGFVSSNYNPPYTNNQPIPYVSGGRRRLYGGESAAIKIPSNCAYLILNTVSGDDVQCTWKMMSGSISSTLQTQTAFAKLRVCSWNIGHFALGTSYDTLITRADDPEMRSKWANRINELDADVMMCCEYNTYVVNAEGNNPPIIASETIFEPFQYSYVGSKPSATSYMQLAIFSPKPLTDVEEVVFPNTTQAGRYYMVGTMKINNIDVKLVAIHLDWNQGETGEANRQLQKQKLVDDFANDEYVIICGDFNTNNGASEFDIFANAGYEMANHGYIGDFPTFPAGNEPVQFLDNILCKGFKISGIHIINDSELTDHCAVYADFTMIEPIKKA